MRAVLLLAVLGAATVAAGEPAAALIVDLDAGRGVVLDGDAVASWESAVPGQPAYRFVQRDEGRKVPGSGRPTLVRATPGLGGRPSIEFRQQELVCLDEAAFDGLTTGAGLTWLALVSLLPQRVGLKDVNSFLGNLRNGKNYEGFWACTDDDGRLWWGPRNSRTFGRFDANNPKIAGPVLTVGSWHVVGGRLAAGTGSAAAELFLDAPTAIARAPFPVEPKADPSRLAIGQERDAINHPGHESFDGSIARVRIWRGALTDADLAAAINDFGSAIVPAGR